MSVYHFSYRRAYTGPIRAVVFDWAGTTVDYGSRAPVAAFIEVFRRNGIDVTEGRRGGPMGIAKRDHLRTMVSLPAVAEAWARVLGRPWTEADVDALYAEFLPLDVEMVGAYTDVIPGTTETVAACRERGIAIGSCTGYSHEIMERVLPAAVAQGYAPDAVVCPEDVAAGRPAPWMIYRNLMDLGVYPAAACVKVGDTVADIEEGLNAGAWSVAVARSGNELGLSEAEAAALPPAELAARLGPVVEKLARAGAHFVIDTVADLPPVLDTIAARLRHGEQP